jgi:hypothetical protein
MNKMINRHWQLQFAPLAHGPHGHNSAHYWWPGQNVTRYCAPVPQVKVLVGLSYA